MNEKQYAGPLFSVRPLNSKNGTTVGPLLWTTNLFWNLLGSSIGQFQGDGNFRVVPQVGLQILQQPGRLASLVGWQVWPAGRSNSLTGHLVAMTCGTAFCQPSFCLPCKPKFKLHGIRAEVSQMIECHAWMKSRRFCCNNAYGRSK